MKILIVEDDASSRIYLERALLSQGYAVESAGDGSTALELAERTCPDLIISDIMMPTMDGFELCRRIKLDERLHEIPFIFYTATYIEHKDEQLAVALGAAKFIVKPMEPENLFRVIRETLEEHLTGGLHAPDQPLGDMAAMDRLQVEVLARKLDKKVRELEQEREASRRSEQKYHRLHESMMDGFVCISMDGRIQEFNESYWNMLGYAPEEIKGISYLDITPAKWHDFERKIIGEQILPRGYSDVYEKEYRKRDGTIFPVELRTFLLKDEKGENEGMWAIVRDVTEKRKLEAQLRHAQKMEAVGQLAGGVAHDFNNILNVIVGFGSLAQSGIKEDTTLASHINEILLAAERAAQLTKRLLTFSRKQAADIKPVSVNDIITDMHKMLSRILLENISLSLRLSSRDMIVMADTGQMEQVLMNLVTNARDAMPLGGELTIVTEIKTIDEGYIQAYGYGKTGRYAMISLTDTGCGIDPEIQNKIFEPFFTTKGIGEGTGLGLAITYGIIKQHDGYIKVYSEPGRGTTFKILLPLVERATSDGLEPAMAVPIRGGDETILVAEDDGSLRELERITLEAYGYRVITAKDGKDALKEFSDNRDRIQLVILDFIMPKMNGKEAYDEIRKIRQDIKVIFASGYTADIISKHEMVKDEELVYKPFAPKDLLGKVREVLDK